MHQFMVTIPYEDDGDLATHSLFLQSEDIKLTQQMVENHITSKIGNCDHGWCGEMYRKLLRSLLSAKAEHGQPMILDDASFMEANHPVWLGTSKVMVSNISFKRLAFESV